MREVKAISPWQFTAFRVALGLYLIQHFADLIPWAAEIWSDEGVLADATLNFTHGVLPNLLEWWGTPGFVTGFVVALLVLSVTFTVGWRRHASALLLWYGWACLFNRNNFISNPGIPYVGLILLLTLAIPAGEPLSVSRRKGDAPWYVPVWVFRAAWILLAVGYTFSGLDKLLTSPSWRDGSALLALLNNPLARPGPLRDLALLTPAWVLQLGTWFALALEILFLPLCLVRRGRLLAWTGMLGLHFGILLVVDFADLTFGMLMIHLFTFDPAWFPPRRPAAGTHVVFFDGVCGLCHRTVRWLIAEDRERVLRYAPLQGETYAALQASGAALPEVDGMVYVRGLGTDDATVFSCSGAMLAILADVGGCWRPLSWLHAVPRVVRDGVYAGVAARRQAWFGRAELCALPTPQDREQQLP